MSGLRPLVWEINYNIGDTKPGVAGAAPGVDANGFATSNYVQAIRGGSKPFPFINCTSYTLTSQGAGSVVTGFEYVHGNSIANDSIDVPSFKVYVGALVVPPSRLHELYYRMIVEWTIEFSQIRSIADISSFAGLAVVGNNQHYQNYDYSSSKAAITGDSSSILESDTCMVSANVDVTKVM